MTLTRERIMSMEAGPEMDALVAERVMGTWPGHVETETADGDYCVFCFAPAWDEKRPKTCRRRYSLDIAAAWEVVERLGDPSGLCAACFTQAPRDNLARFVIPGRGDFSADAPTMALAICRAALLTTLEPA